MDANTQTPAERKAAAEVASRDKCPDFEAFEPLFQQVQKDLDSAVRVTDRFRDNAHIEIGHWFIVDGLKAYVAGETEEFTREYVNRSHKDKRLRVILRTAPRASC